MRIPDQISVIVEGMTCEGCTRSVERALSDVEGVRDVIVNLADKSVTISFDSLKTDEDRLCDVISDAGFRVVEKPTQRQVQQVGIIQSRLTYTNAKKPVAVGAAAGFIGTMAFLAIMFLFPLNPWAIMAHNVIGSTESVGVKAQPGGWLIHSTALTVWAAMFGWIAWKRNLTRIYLGAIGWGLLAWLWTLTIIWVYQLLSPPVVFIELSIYLVYSLVLAAGYSYGVWGTIEAKVHD